MALVAPVVDGKIQDTSASSNSLSGSRAKNGSSLDKDAFLQLLVAQMKYQDPLEPTSNTEYISQFATFSELEQMQNMSASIELQRASALVGQNVILQVTGKTGSVNYVTGLVDYVEIEAGKAYLSVNGGLYSLDDLVTVVEPKYQAAFDKINDLLTDLYKLPSTSLLSLNDMDAVLAIRDTYEGLSNYERGFLTADEAKLIEKYIEKMKDMMEQAGIEDPKDAAQNAPSMEDMMKDLLDKIDQLTGNAGGAGSAGDVEGSGGADDEEDDDNIGNVGDVEDPENSGDTDEDENGVGNVGGVKDPEDSSDSDDDDTSGDVGGVGQDGGDTEGSDG